MTSDKTTIARFNNSEKGTTSAANTQNCTNDSHMRGHSSESENEEAVSSRRRMIMMYDEEGNATPVPIAGYYYDSVQNHPSQDNNTHSPPQEEINPDTIHVNAPAPFRNMPTDATSSSSAGEPEPQFSENSTTISDRQGENFLQDEPELDEEEDVAADDPFQNQFMRIEAPASQLKDVSRVKKDHDHDKPKRKSTIMGGLQRAVSTVRIGEEKSKPAMPSLSRTNSTRASLSQMGRMMSTSKDRTGLEQKTEQGVEKEFVGGFEMGPLERPRESTAVRPGKRQGLATVGRMMSLSKQKSVAIGEDDKGDRPRNLQNPTGGVTNNGTRSSLSQVGRLLSRSRSRVVDDSKDSDGDRQTGDRVRTSDRTIAPSGSRRSIARIGRMVSLTRSKSKIATDSTNDEDSEQRPEISPLSTSTISSNGDSNPSDSGNSDRVRSKPGAAGIKRASSRMSLRSAGRMLSFSRKPSESKGKEASRSTSITDGKDSGRSNQSAPGGKPDGRADKFYFVEIKSPGMRDSDTFENTAHIRVPVIAMAEYSGPVSKTKWYLDGFTLPHNAVRRECVDLYEVLAGFAKGPVDMDVTRADVGALAGWWRVAGSFIKCYFAMERDVLLPWVDAAGTTDWEVQLALTKMRNMKGKLEAQLNIIDGVWGDTKSTPGDLVARLYRAVDDFVPRLMNYFADQEVLLPAIVKGYYTLEDRLRMDRDMVSAFGGDKVGRRERENAHHDLILLVRWMPNARQLRAWIGKNLNGTARSMYPKWFGMWEEEHLQFVKTMRARSRTCDN